MLRAIVLLLCAGIAHAQPAKIVSWGDSYGDESGCCTNGPVVFRAYADRLGLTLVNDSRSGRKADALRDRVRAYVGAGLSDPTARYLLWNNGNEASCLRKVPPCDWQSVSNKSAKAIRDAVLALLGAGVSAANVWVLAPVDYSIRPVANGNEIYALSVWMTYETAVELAVVSTGARYVDINPAIYDMGLPNMEDGCTWPSGMCADPGQYLWWDDLHLAGEAARRLAATL